MRADFRRLFDHDHGEVGPLGGGLLLQPDRRGKAGGPRADDDDIIIHSIARGQFFGHHPSTGSIIGVQTVACLSCDQTALPSSMPGD